MPLARPIAAAAEVIDSEISGAVRAVRAVQGPQQRGVWLEPAGTTIVAVTIHRAVPVLRPNDLVCGVQQQHFTFGEHKCDRIVGASGPALGVVFTF